MSGFLRSAGLTVTFFLDNVGVCSGKHGLCAADQPGSATRP